MCACLRLKLLIPGRVPWFYMVVGAILFDTSKRIWVANEAGGRAIAKGVPFSDLPSRLQPGGRIIKMFASFLIDNGTSPIED